MLLLIVLALSLALIGRWLYHYAFYWQNKGVPILQISSFKNSWNILWFRIPFWKVTENIYWKCQEKYQGFFMMENPSLFVKDLELIQRILVKDFEYFPDRTLGRNPTHDHLGAHILFLTRGYSWKYMRSKVTHAYSSARINLQIPLMEEVAKELCQYLADREHQMIDVKETCAKYSTDVITTSAYGIRGNSFTDQKDNYRTVTAKIFSADLYRAFAFNLHYIAPYLLKFFGLTFLDKSVNKRLKVTYAEQMDMKLKTGTNRNDFLDFLIQLSKKETDSRFNTGHNAMISQAAQYFLAGFETIGSTFCYMLYELAKHQEHQERLRDEITSVMSNYDNINNNAIKEMLYLDMVLKETMRLYPVLPFLDRKIAKDYKIPDTNIILEKDTNVYISIIGMHMDPQYFPNPHKFDPERFSVENKANILPFTYLPIGAGPRICIGMYLLAIMYHFILKVQDMDLQR
ncbi:cytochrome p450 [Holotrichia oblita]|uniref:Cytochrome p450 n=1 Tax=Holotrichia oblita TaxID=644536 RepID=A0ACB9TG35_HOLOL|nr:cytochrome p450 [Holotrichia oblita]